MSLAFDFSKAVSKHYEEPSIKKKFSEKKPKKTNFLKRRSNLKYDPAKSIQEEIERNEKILIQSDLVSDTQLESEHNTEDMKKTSATAIKLSNLIEQEKKRKCKKQKISVKEIMNSSKQSINKSKLNVSETFQNLDYLKQVPKKIDCWLSNSNQGGIKQLSTPRNMKLKKLEKQ